MLTTSSEVALYGVFGIRVYNIRNGEKKCIRRILKKNQIVNTGRQALVELLAPGVTDQYERQLWCISAGTSNTPPTISDTTLISKVWDHAFTAGEITQVISPPNTFEILISVTMGVGENNGETLREAGIYTRGDNDVPASSTTRVLYARQVHPDIVKTASMTIDYEWRLGVLIQ